MSTIPDQALATPPPIKRSGWRRWIVALLIFIGGAAFGAGITIIVSVRSIQQAIQHPERAPARIVARMTKRLDLSREQRRQVLMILIQRQRALQQIRREVQPKVDGQLTALESEISVVLNANQRSEWQKMVRNIRENWLPPASDSEAAPNLDSEIP